MIGKRLVNKDDDPRRRNSNAKDAENAAEKAFRSRGGKRRFRGVSQRGRRGQDRFFKPVRKRPLTASEKLAEARIHFNYAMFGTDPEKDKLDEIAEGRVNYAFTVNDPMRDDYGEFIADDADLVAKTFAEVACLNDRIGKTPFLRYVFSLPLEDQDRADRRLFRDVVSETLTALDLENHLAAGVVHQDTNNRHMHVIVNRVDPITGRATEPFFDVRKIEKVCRIIEQRHGLKMETGRNINPKTLEPWNVAELEKAGTDLRPKTRGQKRIVQGRKAARELSEKLKAQKPFSSATSWDDLSIRLKGHGLSIEAKGNGLVVIDQEGREYKSSDLAGKGGGRAALEKRFGSYRVWKDGPEPAPILVQPKPQVQKPPVPPRSEPSAEELARIREAEKAKALLYLLKFPARSVTYPENWPNSATKADIKTLAKHISPEDLAGWHELTQRRSAEIRNELKADLNFDQKRDLNDEGMQIADGLRALKSIAEYRRVDLMATRAPDKPQNSPQEKNREA